MPTKKRKSAPKKAAVKKSSGTVRAKSNSVNQDIMHTSKAVGYILYIWDLFIVLLIVWNVVGMLQITTLDSTAFSLINILETGVLLFLALVIFKTAKSVNENSDDGYVSAIVNMLFIVIFAFFLMSYGAFNLAGWVFLALGALGLIFLLPNLGKFKKVTSHTLTTWSLVLNILFLFIVVVVMPMIASA